jgi:hypothetical protein
MYSNGRPLEEEEEDISNNYLVNEMDVPAYFITEDQIPI